MPDISKSKAREIIQSFVQEIEARRDVGEKPETHVIAFRDDEALKRERKVWRVPINLLRYRKENGRICSDVLNFEENNYPLDEKNEDDQKILENFLEAKDKLKTEELKKSVMHSGQREPAIITCDGFLINGNRRKMVLSKLTKVDPTKYGYMKVVILPKDGEPGGPPTLLEIEQIENRYQLQQDGKAEYYNFDRALSIRRKIDIGMSLEDQLKDDPRYINLGDKNFKKVLQEYKSEYLEPLECADEYLEVLGKPGRYGFISEGKGDSEGRWQAFLDFNKFVNQKLKDPKMLDGLGIEEDEVGDIKALAYKMIRIREFKDIKLHDLMRKMPKMLSNKDSKRELMKLLEVPDEISNNDNKSIENEEDYEKRYETIWKEKNGGLIRKQVMYAKDLFERDITKETPLDILEGALKKLNHDNLDLASIGVDDLDKAKRIVIDIQRRTKDLFNEISSLEEDLHDLLAKGKKNNKNKK